MILSRAHGCKKWGHASIRRCASTRYTVKQEMLVAIIFGSFKNITIWQRFNLEILLKESGWGYIIWWLVILAKFINSPISPNKYLPVIFRFTICTHKYDLSEWWWIFGRRYVIKKYISQMKGFLEYTYAVWKFVGQNYGNFLFFINSYQNINFQLWYIQR